MIGILEYLCGDIFLACMSVTGLQIPEDVLDASDCVPPGLSRPVVYDRKNSSLVRLLNFFTAGQFCTSFCMSAHEDFA